MRFSTRGIAVVLTFLSPLWLTACNKANDAGNAPAAGAGAKAQGGMPAMPPSVVNTQPVQFQAVPLVKELSGKAVAYQEAVVLPQVSGIVENKQFREGSFVKQGQPLFQINADSYNSVLAGSEADLAKSQAGVNTAEANFNNALASLESRQAELALAKANLARLQTLRGTEAISAQEYDIGVTQVRTAEAAVKNAKAQVGVAQSNINAAKAATLGVAQTLKNNQLSVNRTVVKAPISGVTGRSTVSIGALVNAGQTQMVTISQLNPIYVDISQSSAEMLALRQAFGRGRGDVQLTLPDGSVYPVTGELRFEEAKVDPNTGSVNLRAVFRNDNGLLLPGMLVNAKIVQGVINNAVLLPQSAINRTAKGETTVNVVDSQDKIQVRPVTTQGTYQGQWVVTSGLQQGEQVVILGGAKVKPDQKVVVKPLPAPTTNASAPVANSPVVNPSATAKQ